MNDRGLFGTRFIKIMLTEHIKYEYLKYTAAGVRHFPITSDRLTTAL